MSITKPAFHPFPLNSIKPGGWLKRQLRIQADGLSGHLDEFWPDIKNSAWIGGKAEGWERMPYWLDGVIPLSWLLNDEPLKIRISGYMDYIIKHQHKDGWLGPRIEEKAEARDLWSQALTMKMLVVYYDAANDSRVPGVVEKALLGLDRHIDRNPLSKWGQFRWFEFLIAIWWLYERTSRQWLLDLAIKLQAQGFHWKNFFSHWPLTEPTAKGRWNFAGHVVNNAMALKGDALWWRFTKKDEDRDAVYSMIEKLDMFHGMVTCIFTGDECLAGRSPIQGTELCAVVEYMYSLEILLSVLGDPAFGDRLEKITFNALPATFSPDMWSHQYDQQVNQIECSVRDNRTWKTNSPDANIFGLEPSYGCCTANLSQGWPKFVSHLWMRTGSDGIAAVAYAPSRLEIEIAGVKVRIKLETDYPFREALRFKVVTEQPIIFPFFFRIPEWADNATIEVDGNSLPIPKPGSFYEVKREWKGITELLLTLPMRMRVEHRPNNAISLLRGPLVYALKIDEKWERINKGEPHREIPHGDWEVYSTSPWNYALDINESTLMDDIIISEHPLGDCPFSPDGAPVSAGVKGQRVPEWISKNGSAKEIPASPIEIEGKKERVTLIPYGSTNLRIAEFPITPEHKSA